MFCLINDSSLLRSGSLDGSLCSIFMFCLYVLSLCSLFMFYLYVLSYCLFISSAVGIFRRIFMFYFLSFLFIDGSLRGIFMFYLYVILILYPSSWMVRQWFSVPWYPINLGQIPGIRLKISLPNTGPYIIPNHSKAHQAPMLKPLNHTVSGSLASPVGLFSLRL